MKGRTKTTKRELEASLELARKAKHVLDVQLSGDLLAVIAERVGTGDVKVPLSEVIAEAESRARQASWRRRVEAMIGGTASR